MQTFADRRDAGIRLAAVLQQIIGMPEHGELVVLGLPRGGVPVAAEVVAALLVTAQVGTARSGCAAGTPAVALDVLLVRKLGMPGHGELAMGAIGEQGVVVTNSWVAGHAGIAPGAFQAVLRRERLILEQRAVRYRAVRAAVPLAGRTAVVVDDGVATGATARAACAVAHARGAATVLLAAPVIAASTLAEMVGADPMVADRVVTVLSPADFGGVGQFYRDFSPTTDREVIEILRSAAR